MAQLQVQSPVVLKRALAGSSGVDLVGGAVKQAELASSGGAGVVGFKLDTPDAIEQTVGEALSETYTARAIGCDFSGANAVQDIVNAYIQSGEGKRLIFGPGAYKVTGPIQPTQKNCLIEFLPGAKIICSDAIIPILLNTIGLERVVIMNPELEVTNGANSSGLIQINYASQFLIVGARINADRAALNAASRIPNGFATALDCSGHIIGAKVTGTAKSAYHISTGSNQIILDGCYGSDTGTHDTATYGYSPIFDTSADATKFIDCVAADSQGSGFLVTVGGAGDYAKDVAIVRPIIASTGRDGIEFASNASPTTVQNVEVYKPTIRGAGRYGINVALATDVDIVRPQISTSANAGIFLDSGAVRVSVEGGRIFNNSQSVLEPAIKLRGCTDCTIDKPHIYDNQGVATQTKGIGTTGTAPSGLRILKPKFGSAVSTRWEFLTGVTSGHFDLVHNAVPTGGIPGPIGSTVVNDSAGADAPVLYVRQNVGGVATWVAK